MKEAADPSLAFVVVVPKPDVIDLVRREQAAAIKELLQWSSIQGRPTPPSLSTPSEQEPEADAPA